MELARGAQRIGAEEDAEARVSLQGKCHQMPRLGRSRVMARPWVTVSTTPGGDGGKAAMWKGPPSPPVAQK